MTWLYGRRQLKRWHVSILLFQMARRSSRKVSSIRRISFDISETSFLGFLFLAFNGLSSSNSSSSSCVASKLAFLLSGSKGGRAALLSSAAQSIERIQGCRFSASRPPDPRQPMRLLMSRSNSCRACQISKKADTRQSTVHLLPLGSPYSHCSLSAAASLAVSGDPSGCNA